MQQKTEAWDAHMKAHNISDAGRICSKYSQKSFKIAAKNRDLPEKNLCCNRNIIILK